MNDRIITLLTGSAKKTNKALDIIPEQFLQH